MSNVYFEPWVGCQYSEGINGKRIMVLGHVHVCDGCDNCGVEKCEDFSTQKVVEDYIVWRKNGTIPSPGYEKWLQTYLNFVKAFFGFQPEPEVEETDFWNKITTIFSWPFPLQLPKLLMMLMSELKSLLYLL